MRQPKDFSIKAQLQGFDLETSRGTAVVGDTPTGVRFGIQQHQSAKKSCHEGGESIPVYAQCEKQPQRDNLTGHCSPGQYSLHRVEIDSH